MKRKGAMAQRRKDRTKLDASALPPRFLLDSLAVVVVSGHGGTHFSQTRRLQRAACGSRRAHHGADGLGVPRRR